MGGWVGGSVGRWVGEWVVVMRVSSQGWFSSASALCLAIAIAGAVLSSALPAAMSQSKILARALRARL